MCNQDPAVRGAGQRHTAGWSRPRSNTVQADMTAVGKIIAVILLQDGEEVLC